MNDATKILQAFKDANLNDLTPQQVKNAVMRGLDVDWSAFCKSDLAYAWIRNVVVPEIEWEELT